MKSQSASRDKVVVVDGCVVVCTVESVGVVEVNVVGATVVGGQLLEELYCARSVSLSPSNIQYTSTEVVYVYSSNLENIFGFYGLSVGPQTTLTTSNSQGKWLRDIIRL